MTSANYSDYFWIKNNESNTKHIYIRKNNSLAPTINVEYSTNLSTWTTATTSTTAVDITISGNTKIYFRATADCWSDISAGFYFNRFYSQTGSFSIGGNIMSLLWGSSFIGKKTFPNEDIQGIFNGLFNGWTAVIDASELVLPVTHIVSTTGAMGSFCYRALFSGCTALANGPHIDLRFPENPPSGMLDRALQRMLEGCTSLKSIYLNTQDYNGAYRDIFLNTTYSDLTIYDYSGAGRTSFPTGVICKKMVSLYFGYDRVVDWTRNNTEVEKIVDNNNTIIWQKYLTDPTPYPTEQKALVDNADKTIPSTLSNYLVLKNISSQNGQVTFTSRVDTWLDDGNSYTLNVYNNNGNATTVTFDSTNKSFTFALNAGECVAVDKIGSTVALASTLGYSPRTGVKATVPYALIGSVTSSSSAQICSITCQSDDNLYDASSFSYTVNGTSLLANATVGWFENLFSTCINMVYPPALSVGSIPSSYYLRLYRSTFNNCQSLLRTTSTIKVPDNVNNQYMCYHTYYGCSNLTNADNAVVFGYGNGSGGSSGENRYNINSAVGVLWGYYTASGMFAYCTNLLSAKFSLPWAICGRASDGTVGGNVYNGMFAGCWRLEEPPKLEKTNHYTNVCTSYMTSIASTGSYYNIFYQCYNLQKLILSSNLRWSCPADEYSYQSSTNTWVKSSEDTSTTLWMTVGANPYYRLYKGMKSDNQTGIIYWYEEHGYSPVTTGDANNGYLPSEWTFTTDPWY